MNWQLEFPFFFLGKSYPSTWWIYAARKLCFVLSNGKQQVFFFHLDQNTSLRWNKMICKVLQKYFHYACLCEPDNILRVLSLISQISTEWYTSVHSSTKYASCTGRRGLQGICFLSISNLKEGRLVGLRDLVVWLADFTGKMKLKTINVPSSSFGIFSNSVFNRDLLICFFCSWFCLSE